jgi:hypothetical protein
VLVEVDEPVVGERPVGQVAVEVEVERDVDRKRLARIALEDRRDLEAAEPPRRAAAVGARAVAVERKVVDERDGVAMEDVEVRARPLEREV